MSPSNTLPHAGKSPGRYAPHPTIPTILHHRSFPRVRALRAVLRIEGDDREPQMQTATSCSLRHAYRSSTRSARVLKDTGVDLRSKVQHTRYSRTYSSIPSPSDRDKTAVGVSPPRHSKGLRVCNNGSQVFSPTAAAIFIATGAGLFYYFNSEKESLKKKKGRTANLVSGLQATHNQKQKKNSRLRPMEDLKSVACSRY